MTPEDEEEILESMRAAKANARGYADFFGWAIDRNIEEWGVTIILLEALEARGAAFFTRVKSRGSQDDPPDCEALDANGKRIAIVVTELVQGRAIQRYKCGHGYEWADWSRDKFLSQLSELIAGKGKRYATLKDGPYEGGYVILVFTDEPGLCIETVRSFLHSQAFIRPPGVTRAFFLLSYDPGTASYPYVDLTLSG